MTALVTVSPASNQTTHPGRARVQLELQSLVESVPNIEQLADSFAALLERFMHRHDCVGAVRAAQAGAAIAVLRRATTEKIARLTWLLRDPAALEN